MSELEKFADQIVKISVVAVIKVITNVVSCGLRESDNKCNIFDDQVCYAYQEVALFY